LIEFAPPRQLKRWASFEIAMNLRILFMLVVSSAYVQAHAQNPKRPSHKREIIPNVSYCQLIQYPTRYRNKIVTVSANLFGGFEVSALEDFQCDEERSIWVEFSDSYKACTPNEVDVAFDHIFSGGTMSSNRATIVATGKFQVAPKYRSMKNSPYAFIGGFGHLNRYPFQFTVKCLKSVKPAPWT
jgi:hypothetical protein